MMILNPYKDTYTEVKFKQYTYSFWRCHHDC